MRLSEVVNRRSSSSDRGRQCSPPSHQPGTQARARAPLSMVNVSFAFVAMDESPEGFGNNIGLWIYCCSNVSKPPGHGWLYSEIPKNKLWVLKNKYIFNV